MASARGWWGGRPPPSGSRGCSRTGPAPRHTRPRTGSSRCRTCAPLCSLEPRHPRCSPPVHAVGEVLEHDLSVGVAASLPGGEPGLGGLGGGVEGGGHRDLGLEPGADVDLVDLHERLVQVVLHRHLEPLAGLQLSRNVVCITINTL